MNFAMGRVVYRTEFNWRQFISRSWERSPALFEAPNWSGFCTLTELFEIFLASRGSQRLASDRFWVARSADPKSRSDFSMVSLDLLGPQPSDIDLNGFFSRMEGRAFGINLHRLDKWRPELLERVGEPIERVSEEFGAGAVKRWDIDCFLGTYSVTPFGIHRDRASVFSCCLLGERSYLTWPPDYPWEDGDLFVPDESRLQRNLKGAQQFQVSEGDLFYWPSNRWHVVRSNGRPSVVIQLSAYFGPAGE